MLTNSWGHALRMLSPEEIASAERAGMAGCNMPRCKHPRTHQVEYWYVTGRAGRKTNSLKPVCSGHAAEFAKKNGIPYVGPAPLPVEKHEKRTMQECAACGRRAINLIKLSFPAWANRIDHATYPKQPVPLPEGSLVHKWDRVLVKRGFAWKLGMLEAIYVPDDEKLVEVVVWSVNYHIEQGARCQQDTENPPA
jgi:hypothetical protein